MGQAKAELPLPDPDVVGGWAVDALRDMPSKKSWGLLIAGLRLVDVTSTSEQGTADGPPGLSAAIRALGVINAFLNDQPAVERYRIVQPLLDLASALEDLKSGKATPMFERDPSRSTHGLTTKEMFSRAIAALAMDNLMRTPEYKRKAGGAALVVARALGSGTTADNVKVWRADIKRGVAPEYMIRHFWHAWPSDQVGTTPQERAKAFLYALRENTIRA